MLAFTSNQGKSLWKIQKVLNLKDVSQAKKLGENGKKNTAKTEENGCKIE